MDGKETTNRGAPSAAAGKGRRLAAPGHGKAARRLDDPRPGLLALRAAGLVTPPGGRD